MSLQIDTFTLGPLENNTYLLSDPDTRQAVLVDPAAGSSILLDLLQKRGLTLSAIWLTHAHFDHIAGVQPIATAFHPNLPVGLHPADLRLWRNGGGATVFGFKFNSGSDPTVSFAHGQKLTLGAGAIEVRHTPGHTPGHVIFYIPEASAALVGDLIFQRGVGRTDLVEGDFSVLVDSIHTQVFTLPPQTRLLPGHGPETTVAEEMAENPFLV